VRERYLPDCPLKLALPPRCSVAGTVCCVHATPFSKTPHAYYTGNSSFTNILFAINRKEERRDMQSPLRHNLHKRIRAIMVHTKDYGSKGPGRLAKDAGVSRSTVTRFLKGESTPSVYMVLALLNALEGQLGREVDLRELISLDGTYPTPSVCDLMGCPGCLPPEAHNEDGTTKPEYQHMKGGEWSVTPQPRALTEDEPDASLLSPFFSLSSIEADKEGL
jgi:transcriptional regulator with XRE-family HTH domain